MIEKLLVTSLDLPEDEDLNKKLIGRGERMKARREDPEYRPRPRARPGSAEWRRWLAEAYGDMARHVLADERYPVHLAYQYAKDAAHHARSVPRETVGGPEGEAGTGDD